MILLSVTHSPRIFEISTVATSSGTRALIFQGNTSLVPVVDKSMRIPCPENGRPHCVKPDTAPIYLPYPSIDSVPDPGHGCWWNHCSPRTTRSTQSLLAAGFLGFWSAVDAASAWAWAKEKTGRQVSGCRPPAADTDLILYKYLVPNCAQLCPSSLFYPPAWLANSWCTLGSYRKRRPPTGLPPAPARGYLLSYDHSSNGRRRVPRTDPHQPLPSIRPHTGKYSG